MCNKIDKYSFMYDWLIFCTNIGMYYKELPLYDIYYKISYGQNKGFSRNCILNLKEV